MHRGRKIMQRYLNLKGWGFRTDEKKVQTDNALGIFNIVTLENRTFLFERQFAHIIK